jgi:hypothetical protein
MPIYSPGTFLTGSAADCTCSIDKRINHRVGHSEEKYPHEVTVVDVRWIEERVNNKHNLDDKKTYKLYSYDRRTIEDECSGNNAKVSYL